MPLMQSVLVHAIAMKKFQSCIYKSVMMNSDCELLEITQLCETVLTIKQNFPRYRNGLC